MLKKSHNYPLKRRKPPSEDLVSAAGLIAVSMKNCELSLTVGFEKVSISVYKNALTDPSIANRT